ncbi:peptidase C15, pyroglutamyl peptidase I-like protein [Ceratocystis lukuohia]|uniref:Peptidase C15, pyroglutamyl peptidase I-like protein n=1 Tax=Ceratocystis lukuohia TaxID=2019550 RepID=A0ABR4MAL7_9PEZI
MAPGLEDQQQRPRELTVLVTGFAPFRGFPKNPAWEIADSLPEYLPPPRPNPSCDAKGDGDGGSLSSIDFPHVRIVVYHEPIPVNYSQVRSIVPNLWDTQKRGEHYDFGIHIGMASSEIMYKLEACAHRDGYVKEDDDGQSPPKEPREDWANLPPVLNTDVDVADVAAKWKANCPTHTKTVVSHDPGRFLCDYIYYSSLAELANRKEERRVVFMHVPDNFNDEAVAYGTTTTWWGCGSHIGLVMDTIPDSLRCTCTPTVSFNGKEYPPKAQTP